MAGARGVLGFFGSGFKSNSRLEHVCGIVWKRSRGHFFYRYNPKKCLWIFLTNQNSSLKALHKWRKHHERVSNIRVQRARNYEAIKKLSCLRPLRIFDPLRIRASKKDSVVVSEFLKFSSHLRHMLVVLDFQDWYLTSCEMRAQISGKHLTKKKKTWAGTEQVSVCFHIIFIHTVHWWDLCINTVNQKE